VKFRALVDAIDWGDAPTWIQAAASIAALIAAIVAVVYSHKALKHAKEELDERRDNEARSVQADRVAAWPIMEVDDMTSFAVARSGGNPVLFIRNDSPQPIYAVSVEFRLGNHTPLGEMVLGVVPPGDHRRDPSIDRDQLIDSVSGMSHWSKVSVDIVFRDAAGRNWRRIFGQDLERVYPDRSGAR
jgi:hypothetical protein